MLLKYYGKALNSVIKGRFTVGYCPICETKSIFIKMDYWLRDYYRCVKCKSIPRQRAIIDVLKNKVNNYNSLKIHEFAASGATLKKLKNKCKDYTTSQYFPNYKSGEYKDGIMCENLESLSFEDNTFDIVITQDVFEHLMQPELAFKEIERVLKPNGMHIFTVPYYYWEKTIKRAILKDNEIKYLLPKKYHKNPVDLQGSLVATEWGYDFVDVIESYSRMKTEIITFPQTKDNVKKGLEADFLEVFISKKFSSQ